MPTLCSLDPFTPGKRRPKCCAQYVSEAETLAQAREGRVHARRDSSASFDERLLATNEGRGKPEPIDSPSADMELQMQDGRGCRPREPRLSFLSAVQTRHLDLLPMPNDQKELIHHWSTYLSVKLAIIDGPDNVCRSSMCSRALTGLLSSSKESSADITIFHAICAGAAFNLFELTQGSVKAHEILALKHERLALMHLRYNLGRHEELKNQSLGLAIMACIVVDAIAGTTGRWRAHLAGGMSYLRYLAAHGCDTEDEFIRDMLYMAILCQLDVQEGGWDLLGKQSRGIGPDPSYGACSSFFSNLARMNQFSTAKHRPPTDQELDAFELQLHLSCPSPQSPSLKIKPNHRATVIHHVAKAFHYASIVYFQRSIRRRALDASSDLVESGVHELETIESLTRDTAGCMTMWPALVLAAEASTFDLQLRMTQWFQTKHKLGFRNVRILREVVEEVWTRRARSCVPREVSWQAVMAEQKYDVFRL
ncbi:hypothetical protein AYO20_10334 [Fonsecaea nubica]|uniref:Uncharacterized protein n=1 Tax=Fonsecaea nubica TaxID=856822 RepID=A0A178CA55_9EURO|nr:hypothetical protein AYO20_10334 [Fonsecaea nubica]OAL25872.1 hypothetical protein AYO20_10334 [Fonsecaea nubica]